MPSRILKLFVLACVFIAVVFPAAPIQTAQAEDYVAKAYDKGSPFGIVSTLANRVRDDEQDAAVALMREAGVQWAREEIFWDKLQPQRDGPFLWGGSGTGFYNYDAAINRLHTSGINILGLLDYNPAWFKSKNPLLDEWIVDWGDYVYNTVARYGRVRGQIKYWEIWNEPNLRKFGYENGLYTIQDYVRLLTVARAAARAADPEAVIVLGGLSSIWSDIRHPEDYDVAQYLRLLHAAGGWDLFDVLAIHPYRPGPPEAAAWRRDTAMDFEAELRSVDQLLVEFGNKPVWITEIAWSTYEGYFGVTDNDQAAFLVRMYLLAMAHPSVQRVFWYDLRNDTAPDASYEQPVYNRGEHEFHFGLLRRTYPLDPNHSDLRKPAFVAYRTMTEILSGMQADGVLAKGDRPTMPGTFSFRYSGGGRSAVVLWRVSAEAAPVIEIDCACRAAQVRQYDGRLLAVLQTEGKLYIRLDYVGVPLYVTWGEDRQKDGQLFTETGHFVGGAFLRYWQQHGGVPQFGYPISGIVVEPEFGTGKPRLVQYFERNRFEYIPEHRNTPHEVQLGRLGDALLQSMGIDWRTLPRVDTASPDCLSFAQTGHRICPPFRTYWERSGGLNIFGLPLTEAYNENGVLVQYFERNRLEYHTQLVGTPNELQVGLLGRALYSRWSVFP